MTSKRQIVNVKDPYHDVRFWYDAGRGSVVPTEDRLITMEVKNVPVDYPKDLVPVGDGIKANVIAASKIVEDVSLLPLIQHRNEAIDDGPFYEDCTNCDTCPDADCPQSIAAFHRDISKKKQPEPLRIPTPQEVLEKCNQKKLEYYMSENGAYDADATFDPYEDVNYSNAADVVYDPQIVEDMRNYHQATKDNIGAISRASLHAWVGPEPMHDLIDTTPNRAALVENIVERFGDRMTDAIREVVAPLAEFATQAAVFHGTRAATRVLMTRAVKKDGDN